MMLELEIKRMLLEFINEIKSGNWFGKERELVSRFAFSTLVKNAGCCDEFQSADQIGIEVRVKQITEGKSEVCKDLIIKKSADQTAWSDDHVPHCIIEWKHRNKKPSQYDIDWLKAYTSRYDTCLGIALNVENESKYEIQASIIKKGEITDSFII